MVSDRWYQSLFPCGPVTGEIAEAYCALAYEDVRKVHNIMPDTKIIFVLRNPMERVLSQAKLGLSVRKNRRTEDVSEAEFIAYIDRPGSNSRSSYSKTLETWESFFSSDHFQILFYEELVEDPFEFLRKICVFLGVEFREQFFSGTVASRPNDSRDGRLPQSVVRHAARVCRPEIDKLAQRFGGPAARWQNDVEKILD
jgi:hypothetical protein